MRLLTLLADAADTGPVAEGSSKLRNEAEADSMVYATSADSTRGEMQHHPPAADLGSPSSHLLSPEPHTSASTLQDSSQLQRTGHVQPETNQQGGVQTDRQQTSHAQQSAKQSAVAMSWSLLSDGALPACCAAVQASTDAHHKFHAVSALAFCLDRIKHCLQVRTPCHQTQGSTFCFHCLSMCNSGSSQSL